MNYTLALLFVLSVQAHAASVLRFQNLSDDWKVHILRTGSIEKTFSGNADAVLNYKEKDRASMGSVFVRSFPLPEQKLEASVEAWHKVVFPNKASVKFTTLFEGVSQVDGQWRYIIYYQADTKSQLGTMIMATIADGKLRLMEYEDNRTLVIALKKPVGEMFKTVTISEVSEDTQK